MNKIRNSRKSWIALAAVVSAGFAGPVSAELLGVSPQYPLLTFNNGGSTSFDAASSEFSVAANPIAILMQQGGLPIFILPDANGESVDIRITVDGNGVASTLPGDDLAITGQADLDGDGVFEVSGVLLTGEIVDFGFLNVDGNPPSGLSTDLYDFRFAVTGGALSNLYPGGSIGIQLTSERSSFNNDFKQDFSGRAKGTLGLLPVVADCTLALDKKCLVPTPASATQQCSEKIAAFRVHYTGPTISGASTVEFEGGSGASAVYDNVMLVSGVTVLDMQNGYSIDSLESDESDLGSKTKIYINGVEEELHTSCSTPFTAGAPAPLNEPKGDPSPNWFVEAFREKNGTVVEQPSDPVFADECEINLGGGTECEKRPTEVSVRYNGGDCAQSSNSQSDDKWDCNGDAGNAEPVRIVFSSTGGSTLYADQDGVMIGQVVTGSAGGDEFGSDSTIKVYSAGGTLLQTVRLHTSCSQPLILGDRFGALEVVGFVNEDQGSVQSGTEVIYQYIVENTGNSDVFNIAVTDTTLNPNDVPGSPIASIAANSSQTLMTSVFLDGAVSGSATATGETAGGSVCTDTDTLSVGVAMPPPCLVSGDGSLKLSDDKIEWKLSNNGAETITILSISLGWPDEHGDLKKVKLAGDTIFDQLRGAPSTVIDGGWKGDTKDRQIKAGDTEKLEFEFDDKFKQHTQADFTISVEFAEGCVADFVPGVGTFECDKPIDQLVMIWDSGSDGDVSVKAYKGDVGDELLLDQSGIMQGDEVTVSGLAGSPNNVYWEIFNASGAKIGESVFHLSCSDDDMDGSDDCGTRQGNGKSNDSNLINDWLLEGMTDQSGTFDCSELAATPRP